MVQFVMLFQNVAASIFVSDKTDDVNSKIFKMVAAKIQSKSTTKHFSWKFKCMLYSKKK